MLLHISNAASIFVGQGNAMHAQVYPAHGDRFKEMVKEGRVYNFCYFRIKKANSYIPVPNDLMATFSTWTTIEEVAEIPPAFPEYVYTLVGHTPRVLMQGRRKSRRRTPTRIPLYSY
jgi:hypothetical protein